MIVVPAIEAVAFWGVLRRPKIDPNLSTGSNNTISTTDASISTEKENELKGSADDMESSLELSEDEKPLIGLKAKIKYVPSLLKYMIPLTLVYFLEYFINQGLVRIKTYYSLVLISHYTIFSFFSVVRAGLRTWYLA